MMRRREFVLSLGGVAAAATAAAYGQQATRLPVVGFLVAGTPSSHGAWVEAFARRLSELGWTDGRNIKIEYRWAGGDVPQTRKFATELVQQKVGVIVMS